MQLVLGAIVNVKNETGGLDCISIFGEQQTSTKANDNKISGSPFIFIKEHTKAVINLTCLFYLINESFIGILPAN